jgi:hypothetical protein
VRLPLIIIINKIKSDKYEPGPVGEIFLCDVVSEEPLDGGNRAARVVPCGAVRSV